MSQEYKKIKKLLPRVKGLWLNFIRKATREGVRLLYEQEKLKLKKEIKGYKDILKNEKEEEKQLKKANKYIGQTYHDLYEDKSYYIMQTIIKQKFPQANFQNKDVNRLLKVYYKYNKSDLSITIFYEAWNILYYYYNQDDLNKIKINRRRNKKN